MVSLRAMLREPGVALLSKKYTDGVSYDIAESCKAAAAALHHQGSSFTLLLGEKDRLFPPDEVLTAVQDAGIKHVETVIMPGASHGTLANRAGKAALSQAISIARR